MKKNLSILTLCALLFFACKKDTPTSKPQDPPPPKKTVEKEIAPFVTTQDSLIKKGGGPCKTDFDCMNVSLHWPVLNGGTEIVRNKVNKSIHLSIANLLYSDTTGNNATRTLEQLTDTLIADYKLEYEEAEAFGMGWANEIKSRIDLHHKVAALQLYNYTFYGGAHPNHYTKCINYNLNSGDLIGFDDIIKDTTALKPILVKLFEAEMQEKTGEVSSAGDFFWGEGFQFSENFILNKESIVFLYNPYEAAAYVFGEILLDVPYSDLNGIVDLEVLK